MTGLFQDFRYALRKLRTSPGFFLIAVLTLALGVGANTAIFSMVDGLILRPLPIESPAQMQVLSFATGAANAEVQFSYPEFEEIREQTTDVFSGVTPFIFGGLMGAQNSPSGMTVEGTTKSVQTMYVGGNFFELLGVTPFLGRFILPTEGTAPGADPVVVLSYNYWQSRFRDDPSVIGKTVLINGQPVTVAGVASKGFLGPTPIVETQAYLPLGMLSIERGTAKDFLTSPQVRSMIALARVKPGANVEQVQSSLDVVGARLLREYPREGAMHRLRTTPLRPPGIVTGTNPFPKLAALFLALAGMVLALACVNVANLFLVRAGLRQREMAVRSALGAPRGRLIRQLLAESLLLASFGCIGGVVLGLAGSRMLSTLSLQSDLPLALDFGFDWRLFAYAFAVAMAIGVFVAILPALRVSRGNLREILHQGGRTSTSGPQRLRSILVAVEVGGALALLIVAGLFVRSLRGVQKAEVGFDPRPVLNLTFDANEIAYTEDQGKAFYREMLERARALPGVRSASLASVVPLSDSVTGADLIIPGHEVPKGQPAPHAENNSVSPGYFKTMSMELLRGRDLNEGDNDKSTRVAVINQAMAESYWPGQDPVGRSFATSDDAAQPIVIVGVVKNSRMSQMWGPYEPIFYQPLAQHYAAVQTLQVRTEQPPLYLARAIQEIAHSFAPAMPVYGVRTMEEALHGGNGLLFFELGAGLAVAMGSLGLILALVGVYGVISYSVSQRRQEIGIRMALGAMPGDILKMVGRQGLMIVAIGLLAGLLAAFAVGRLLGDFLVGVTASDPMTFVCLSVLLTFVALLAGYIPARRAGKVDPVVALRYE